MNEYKAAGAFIFAEQPDLGLCCSCGQEGPAVRNILSLHLRAPVPGTGWGCFECDRPSDGALAVVCDACMEKHAPDCPPLREVVSGYMTDKGRAARESLTEPFDHDLGIHEARELERRIRQPMPDPCHN